MASIYDIVPHDLIKEAASELKKDNRIKAPAWAPFVKTGVSKERPPVEHDWWYVRVASVLRSVYRLGPIGVSKLRVKYGGKKNRGYKPESFFPGSGSIIRKALQQLEQAQLVRKFDKQGHKGRIITPQGKSFLDGIAFRLIKNKPHETKANQQETKPDKPHETKANQQETKPDKPHETKANQQETKPAAVQQKGSHEHTGGDKKKEA